MALEFTINLNGNFAGALQKSNKELGETEKQAKHAEKAMELFEGELGKVQAGALGINFNAIQEGGHFFQFDLAEAATVAYEAIEKVVDKVIELGEEILKAAAGAEDLDLAIELDVGKEGLEKVSDLAESFGNTRFDEEKIKQALLPIIEESGDEEAGMWDDLATAATDVATRRKTGVQGAQTALDALRSIEIQPQKIRGALKELGIRQLDFYSDLGDLLGISQQAAEKQVKAGKVKAQTLLSVALHQIAEREGGALGIATNRGNETLGATLERLGNLKEQLFRRVAGGPGVKEFQHAVDIFIDKIGGPMGQRAMGAIDHLFGALGSFANKNTDAVFTKIANAVEFIASAIEGHNETWNRWMRNWDTVSAIVGMALGPFLLIRDAMFAVEGAFIKVGLALDGFLLDVGGVLKAAVSGNFQKAFELGTAIWQGIRDGIVSGVKQVGQAIEDLASGAVASVKHKLHIGGPALAGGALPAMAEGGIVSRPTIALIGEAGPEAVVPLGRRFGAMPQELAANDNASRFGAPTLTYAPSFQFSGAPAQVREQIEDFEQQHRVAMSRFIAEVRAAVGG